MLISKPSIDSSCKKAMQPVVWLPYSPSLVFSFPLVTVYGGSREIAACGVHTLIYYSIVSKVYIPFIPFVKAQFNHSAWKPWLTRLWLTGSSFCPFAPTWCVCSQKGGLIKNRASGTCMDATGLVSGNHVKLNPCTENMRWKWEFVLDKEL